MQGRTFFRLPVIVIALAAAMFGQAPGPNRAIGVVTSISSSGFTVKTDSGEMVEVAIGPDTRFQRVAPGEKDLTHAQTITAADVAAGDRVLARGNAPAGGTNVTARSVIVMSRSDLAQKQEKERAEWIHRGMAGLVVSTDPAANEIRIRVPIGIGQVRLATVAVGSNTRFRRYPPDSVRFADAKPSTLAELRPGDQLRALGEKSEDGTRITAEEVVSGSFQTVAGSVATVDAAGGLMQMKELGSGKLLTVRVTADSVLRRAPQFPMGPRGAGGPAGPNGEAQAQEPRTDGQSQRGIRDFQQMFERMPSISVSEIKPGETIVVSATRASATDQVTAVTLLAGADALLARSRAAAARQDSGNGPGGPSMGSWNLGDMSMIPMP